MKTSHRKKMDREAKGRGRACRDMRVYPTTFLVPDLGARMCACAHVHPAQPQLSRTVAPKSCEEGWMLKLWDTAEHTCGTTGLTS